MNFRLNNLVILVTLIFSINTHAESPNNWTNYYSDNDVKIEYQYVNCEYSDRFNQEFVILKITNLTSSDLLVKWVNESWYDKKCINCSDNRTDEASNKVLIPANQVLVGDCNIQDNLRIFSKFSDRIEDMPGIKKIVELTKFKLKDINIVYE
ncbi:MAG: hypothetical protein CMD09_03455 [Flavobacteriales bacterium]|mgnify:CR=1 FL=1|nr:hypothetical protein [Flavobacteriales bacterium]OUW94910.1 MAG: hypothetical protein CBD88_05130 [Flavobacteriales bacterium TMED228]|tara:strand:+ start:31 stop:486 length:456 start_codon:yes stop_codon:yes gene_type:complete